MSVGDGATYDLRDDRDVGAKCVEVEAVGGDTGVVYFAFSRDAS